MANVPEHDQPSASTDATPHPPAADPISASEASRRAFLTGLGTVGLGGLMACVTTPARAINAGASAPVKVDMIESTKTLRYDTLELPSGKEVFLDQQVTGANGVLMITRTHSVRTDTEVAYNMHLDITVLTFAPGKSVADAPDLSRTQSISIAGIKGDIVGPVRNDHMTVTVVHPDGTSSRFSQVTPVRMDLSQYDQLAPDVLMKMIGDHFLNGTRLPFNLKPQ